MARQGNDEEAEVECKVIAATARAIRVTVTDDEDDAVWLPRSCIDDRGEDISRGAVVTIGVQQWLAEREGLV